MSAAEDDFVQSTATTISLQVVRTSATEASAVGFTDGPNEAIEVLVNGSLAASGIVKWTGEYWILRVPVVDEATVRTRIGSTESPFVVVPPYVPPRVGPPGFIYREGTKLMLDGGPVALFGVNDHLSTFVRTFWGGGRLGENGLWPSGPSDITGEAIEGVSSVDALWREYFRYFLHFQQSGDVFNPPLRALRMSVFWDYGSEGGFSAWKNNQARYYDVFDRMIYWAKRAGVYVVPMVETDIGKSWTTQYFDRSSSRYAHLVEYVRAMMVRYEDEPAIAMWDIFNEGDVLQKAYWDANGGLQNGYRQWCQAYMNDVRSYTTNHLVTIGHGLASAEAFFSDSPGFGVRRHLLFNDIVGQDVSHEHAYFSEEDEYLLDWRRDWGEAHGKPYLMGEYGYAGGGPLGYGYWPWMTEGWMRRGAGPALTMVLLDSGRGAYAGYPYYGALPLYPGESDPLPIPTDAWRGQYYDDENLTARRIERVDPTINFDFGTGSPDPSIAPDTFSARWEGYWAFSGGSYRLNATSDDGIRIWVDNASAIDEWRQQPQTTFLADVVLAAGVHHVKVEWNELMGGAFAMVSWTALPRVSSATWDATRSRLEVVFSKAMDFLSVEASLSLEPDTDHTILWTDETRLYLVLTGPIEQGRVYVLTISAAAMDKEGAPLSEEFRYEFRPTSSFLELPLIVWGLLLGMVVLVLIVAMTAGRLRSRRRQRRP